MNEEEKETIKYFYNLRSTIDESNMLFEKDINVKHGKETIRRITIILNLIEKLQKENKELRKKLDEENKRCMMLAIEKQDCFEKYRYHLQQNESLTKEFSNIIPILKIKDKIEDLKMSGGSDGKDNTENAARELAIEALQDILDESKGK